MENWVIALAVAAPLFAFGEQLAGNFGKRTKQSDSEGVLAAQAGTWTVASGPRYVGCSGTSNWPRTKAAASMAWAGSSGAAMSGVARDQAPIAVPIANRAQQ